MIGWRKIEFSKKRFKYIRFFTYRAICKNHFIFQNFPENSI